MRPRRPTRQQVRGALELHRPAKPKAISLADAIGGLTCVMREEHKKHGADVAELKRLMAQNIEPTARSARRDLIGTLEIALGANEHLRLDDRTQRMELAMRLASELLDDFEIVLKPEHRFDRERDGEEDRG